MENLIEEITEIADNGGYDVDIVKEYDITSILLTKQQNSNMKKVIYITHDKKYLITTTKVSIDEDDEPNDILERLQAKTLGINKKGVQFRNCGKDPKMLISQLKMLTEKKKKEEPSSNDRIVLEKIFDPNQIATFAVEDDYRLIIKSGEYQQTLELFLCDPIRDMALVYQMTVYVPWSDASISTGVKAMTRKLDKILEDYEGELLASDWEQEIPKGHRSIKNIYKEGPDLITCIRNGIYSSEQLAENSKQQK